VPGLFDTVTNSMLTKQEDGSYATRLYGPFTRLKPKPLLGIQKSSAATGASARKRTSRANRRKSGAAEAEEVAEELPEE
jgi:hypothetical protein